MIFLTQFRINKYLLLFSKTTNCTCPSGWCNFISLGKIYPCLFIPNWTQNHVITYTNWSDDGRLEQSQHVYTLCSASPKFRRLKCLLPTWRAYKATELVPISIAWRNWDQNIRPTQPLYNERVISCKWLTGNVAKKLLLDELYKLTI